MDVRMIQRQLRWNSTTIHYLELTVVDLKNWLAYDSESQHRKELKRVKRDIQRLAELQKALKRDLKRWYIREAEFRRFVDRQTGECFKL